jgi:adenosine deaminase
MDLTTFIAGMPKAELHVHLEGTLEPSLVRAIAARNNLPVPTSLSERSSGYDFHDLTSFLAVYYPNMAVLQTATDFHDVAYKYLAKAASQNIVHSEMFFDPQAHTGRGVPFPVVLRGYRQAMERAQRELGISSSLIMCFLRDMSAEFAMATLMEALPFKDQIIGVGLDSDERGNPPRRFKEVFERARREGFLVTMHCDIDQEGSVEHIRQALEMQVDRIDHGTNVVEDERLVEELKTRGIGLTCCPVSNSVVTQDFKGREISDLLRRGVKVTINSDDPAYFRAYLNENLEKMTGEGAGMTRDELVQLQRNAFEISWVSSWRRNFFLEKLQKYADRHAAPAILANGI